MASNFPTSVDNIPDLQDGVDYIEADDVNAVKDEAEAGQTYIGASGAAQSHNTDILTQLLADLPTIRLVYKDAATLTASAGVSKPRNAAVTIRKLRKNTSTVDITGADLDTGAGSFAASTTYYVYSDGLASGTTLAFSVSTNASAPADSTVFELIGGFCTDGSGNVSQKSVWSVAGMRVVNFKYVDEYDKVEISSTIPNDTSKPQISEGTEFNTIDYIPQSANNIIMILVIIYVGGCSSGVSAIGAIFKDSDADALCASQSGYVGNGASHHQYIIISYITTAGSVAKRTYKVRVGCASGSNTIYINGDYQNNIALGGVVNSPIIVIEFEV